MIGERIRTERKRRGWSQSELARRAGLTPQAVSLLEQGKRSRPGSDTLQGLAHAFSLTVDQLLTEESKPLEHPPVEELRALDWAENELRDLEVLWPLYSNKDRSEIISIAHEMFQSRQEMERRQQGQKDKLMALLSRHRTAT